MQHSFTSKSRFFHLGSNNIKLSLFFRKFTDLSLFEDELLEESTLSMPNLLQDDSNLDGVDE